MLMAFFIYCFNGFVYKGYPCIIFIFQLAQYLFIKNKKRQHRVAAFEGMVQPCVILYPQIAAKPKNVTGCSYP
jgi:hypothetical protein